MTNQLVKEQGFTNSPKIYLEVKYKIMLYDTLSLEVLYLRSSSVAKPPEETTGTTSGKLV